LVADNDLFQVILYSSSGTYLIIMIFANYHVFIKWIPLFVWDRHSWCKFYIVYMYASSCLFYELSGRNVTIISKATSIVLLNVSFLYFIAVQLIISKECLNIESLFQVRSLLHVHAFTMFI